MTQFETVIRGGTVVTASDTFEADVGISEGKIQAIGRNLPAGEKTIEAKGRLVLPGGVDGHCHLDQPTGDGSQCADDFYTGTVAAAFGGLLAGALLTIAAFAIGRWFYLGALPTGSSTATATTVFDTLTRFVRGATRVVATVGLVGLLAALLAGPSRPAVALRRGVSRVLGKAGDEAADHGVRLGAFGAFVAEYVVAIRVAIVAVAVLVLVIQDRPSAGTVLWAAGLTLLALAVLQVLARIGAAGSADPDVDIDTDTDVDAAAETPEPTSS